MLHGAFFSRCRSLSAWCVPACSSHLVITCSILIMENEDDLKVEDVLSSPAHLSGQSLSMDCFEQSDSILDETSDSCINTCNDLTKKEFEYNQFFILAETSSTPEKSSLNCLEQSDSSKVVSTVEHNDSHTKSDQIYVKAENCEVFHGILESEGFVIVPTRRDLQQFSSVNNGCDIFRESYYELDDVDDIDQKLIHEVDAVMPTSATRSVAESFLNDLKQNNETRCKILEEREEDDIVEDLLSRPDFADDETSEGNSTTSTISTAFDLEGEDALRMAEIDEKLERFIEIHSKCGSPSLTSVTLSVQKQQSMCSQNSNEAMRTPSLEYYASAENEGEAKPRSFSSSVEDYLSEKKESRKHQEKVETIDRRLRELIVGEIPSKLPKEQLDLLISQCMMEQNLEVTMRPFLCLKA